MQRVKDGISGSMIGELTGLSPWAGSGPHHVWSRIFGLDKEREGKALRRGTHMGPALCAWYAEETGQVVTHIGRHEKQLVSPRYPLVRATPDGMIRRTKASKPYKVLEVKSPGVYTAGDWGESGTDEIPEYYIPQPIWEMEASDTRECDVVPLIVMPDGGFPIYTVKWDAELFGMLYEIAEKFWTDHVLTETPPPPDGGKASAELLARLFPRTVVKDVIEATPEQQAILDRYSAARAAREAGEAAEELAKQELIAAIGEHQAIVGAAGRMSMIEKIGNPAWKRIAEELGATASMVEQHRGPSVRFARWTPAKVSGAKKKG